MSLALSNSAENCGSDFTNKNFPSGSTMAEVPQVVASLNSSFFKNPGSVSISNPFD